MKRMLYLLALLSLLGGCVATAVSTAVDVTTEVIKVPFKVGGAVVDAVSSDGEGDKKEK
ncbi:NF038104 family lipoprotein [Mariprofundus erugo]|uniref:NF038104 family lipoprotein n=1 Tax=Mariprofundus erugo TaxID=2528639 RepID=UPI0013C375FC|nr:NF038104 family lipoprotein [Mariprofundus erugo]